MAQKYKFFIKGNAVIFSQGGGLGNSDVRLINVWVSKLTDFDLDHDEHVQVADIKQFMSQLFMHFKCIRAGGGFVVNQTGELLIIHRRGFWDLPKGKTEEGESIDETAMREVEEECSISGLKIISKPFTTYHLFKDAGQTIIKESIWYAMSTNDKSTPEPQIEEDIERAEWVSLPVSNEIRAGAYSSIVEVIDHFESLGSSFFTSSETSGG